MLLYPLEKGPLFVRKLRHPLPVDQPPQSVAKDGSQEPSREHGGCDGDAGADDGVEWDEFDDVVGLVGVVGEEVEGAGGGGDEADEGGG